MKRRFYTQIEYDTWEGWVTGWLVIDRQTGQEQGPFSRNHALYLARKLNKNKQEVQTH